MLERESDRIFITAKNFRPKNKILIVGKDKQK